MNYNVVAATNEDTVVATYEPSKVRSDSYQSEAELEKEFIRLLCEQGYTYLPLHTEDELIANLRSQLEELNHYQFSDTEWQQFFSDVIANPNEHIPEKTRKIQEDNVQVLHRDDGSSKNITLIDKKNIHNNRLQVINQYEVKQADGARHDNRYDVTILVNGFPLVHVELKRRGVAIREAFNQINRYQRDSFWAGCGLYEYTQIFVISNGTNTKYYSNSTRYNAIKDAKHGKTKKEKTSNSFEFTSYWADANNRVLTDLIDFTRTFFAKHTILSVLTRYCIFTSEKMLMVMRPYQITDPTKRLRIATIYSYGANEAETDGILDEENPEDTSNLDQSSRDFLDAAIQDYNEMFHTNYSTDGERFQNYYKDVSLRMKNKELDLLIVVNMFLTGFDATTLNTLWVDKNLKMHGLIQAFSRTNRILNSIKTFGNIVCFRNLQKRVDAAISLFGDKNAGGIVLLRKYADYYHGYMDEQGKYHQGYTDMIDDLTQKFPLTEPQIVGEQNQKDFIVLFGALLRMRNLLSSFDDFKGNELISERDLQDYLGRYQDLRDEWRNKKHDETKEDITDDVVFEVELIRQVEINIDYILMLVKKYHDTHCNDKEVLITIRKAIDASPELRSKKQLIETFIAGVNDVDDVMAEWNTYVSEQREKELAKIIQEEKLKEPETRKYLANAFRDGEIKTVGTDIDKLMPPVSRFGGGGRAQKKQGVIDKLKSFFDKFFGIGGNNFNEKD